jgi:hypothetical protein
MRIGFDMPRFMVAIDARDLATWQLELHGLRLPRPARKDLTCRNALVGR